jgi:hypothetical protein
MTPAEHSAAIVELLPHAEHVVVHDAGHLLMLEHPDVVTSHLRDLVERSLRSRPGRRHHRLPSIRRTVTSLRRRRRAKDQPA